MVPPARASEDPLALQYKVVSALARSRDAGEGLSLALERIVMLQGWDIGVAWLADGEHLHYATEFVSPKAEQSPAVQAFRKSVRRWVRGPGASSAGTTTDIRLCWCEQRECAEQCAWTVGAAQIGMRSAVALPLGCDDRIYGTIELFGYEGRDTPPEHRAVLEAVAGELGRFLKARRYETRMQSRHARLAEAQRIARLAYWECSVVGGRLRSSDNMWEALGTTHDSLPVTLDDYFTLVPQDEHPRLRSALADLQNPDIGRIELEHNLRSADGEMRVIVIRGLADFDATGKPVRLSGTLQDITSYRQLEDRLRLAATAIDHVGEAIVICDARGAILSTNPAFTRITGYTAGEAQGWQLDALLNRPTGRHDESIYRRILGRLRTFGRWKGELWALRRDGREFAMLLGLSEVRDGMGRVTHHVGVFTDISRQKKYKERLERLALHDSLTGLPNRALFLDRGQQALAISQRNGTRVGLVFVDLDLFKSVNDRYGHAVGDQVLKEVGSRMRCLMRDCDTVARLGGDEFVVLITDVHDLQDCVIVAERLAHVLSQPYKINGLVVEMGASLGVALSRDHGTDIHVLLHRADQALYSIKRNEQRRYAVWTPDLEGVGSDAL